MRPIVWLGKGHCKDKLPAFAGLTRWPIGAKGRSAAVGRQAPGGPVSPFSGKDVRTMLDNHYWLVEPEAEAVRGDILADGGHRGPSPFFSVWWYTFHTSRCK
jgi:hypothetical protein